MKRAILILLGIVLLLSATPLLVGGVVLAAISSDGGPTVAGRLGEVETSGYAAVSDTVEVDWNWPFAENWDITIGVTSANSDAPVFLGYGPAEAVDGYLTGVPHTVINSIGTGAQRPGDVEVPGTAAPQPPAEQRFWTDQASGVGRQEISVVPELGDYRFVVMNADATTGVRVTVHGSMALPFLFPAGIALAVIGGLLAIVGIALLVLGIRATPAAPTPTAGGTYGNVPAPAAPQTGAPYPGSGPPTGSAPGSAEQSPPSAAQYPPPAAQDPPPPR